MKGSNLLTVGVAREPYPGELVSGDRHTVVSDETGVLVALVDALGHGEEAADAATIAVSTVENHAGESLPALFRNCHEKLQRKRGVAMSLAHFSNAGYLRWLSVGNVDGVLLSGDHDGVLHRQHMVLRGGVVGYRLPRLVPREMAISPQDVVIMATDGIRRDYAQSVLDAGQKPQALADLLLQQYGKGSDDALVLVAQYHGVRS